MYVFEMHDKKKARLLFYGLFVVIGTVLISYGKIKTYFSKQTAEVVSGTLQQDVLKIETSKLAGEITKSVLEDQHTFDFLQNMLNDLTRDKQVQKFLKEMLYEIYCDPDFQEKTKEFVLKILTDKEFLETVQTKTTQVLSNSVEEIVNDSETKTHVRDALIEIMKDTEFLNETSTSAWRVWRRFCSFGLWK